MLACDKAVFIINTHSNPTTLKCLLLQAGNYIPRIVYKQRNNQSCEVLDIVNLLVIPVLPTPFVYYCVLYNEKADVPFDIGCDLICTLFWYSSIAEKKGEALGNPSAEMFILIMLTFQELHHLL